MTGLNLRFAARSEIGRVRRNNEDAGYAASDLLIVADGMGGHEAGELASAATVAPALKVMGRNLSSEVSVGAVWSKRKKRPHCDVVQSTVTPLPVMVLATLRAIAPVGLVVPGPPAAVTQS